MRNEDRRCPRWTCWTMISFWVRRRWVGTTRSQAAASSDGRNGRCRGARTPLSRACPPSRRATRRRYGTASPPVRHAPMATSSRGRRCSSDCEYASTAPATRGKRPKRTEQRRVAGRRCACACRPTTADDRGVKDRASMAARCARWCCGATTTSRATSSRRTQARAWAFQAWGGGRGNLQTMPRPRAARRLVALDAERAAPAHARRACARA